MATVKDYDARRVTESDSQEGSAIRELAPTSRGSATAVLDDDSNDSPFFDLPGADLSNEELTATVIPQRVDEFTCSSCFLVQHRSRLSRTGPGPAVCADCA